MQALIEARDGLAVYLDTTLIVARDLGYNVLWYRYLTVGRPFEPRNLA
ncbi:MAG: hypothetical protein ACREA4_01070 [Nitrososphaera sp.]